jgi:hypothetical protein
MRFVFQQFQSINENALRHCDYEIDGVEIFFAIRASGYIGFTLCGRIEFMTHRATKAQVSIIVIAPNIQFQHIDDNRINGDIVSQSSQQVARVVF